MSEFLYPIDILSEGTVKYFRELPNKTYKNFVDSVKYILDNSPKSSILLLETSAGNGSKIGGSLKDFAKIYKRVISVD